MQRTITYLYPDAARASNLKIFQDRTNQIKAFYFTKDNLKDIEKMDSSSNYAIYFLFDNSEEGANRVYVGQSMNGIGRIYDHVRNKDFWTYCILFVTDNNSFDKLAIDYMEYEFIKKLKKSSYILMNKDLRTTEPNVSIYDKPNLLAYIDQIEFLLNAEGVVLDVLKAENSSTEYYYPKSSKYNAKLFIKDGKFVLAKDSCIKRPVESSKNWKSDRFYIKNNSLVDDYINDGKVEEKDGSLILTVNIAFDTPSQAASLITGLATNGWQFFKNLNELRVLDEEV
mgnify:CR=1 FL=1